MEMSSPKTKKDQKITVQIILKGQRNASCVVTSRKGLCSLEESAHLAQLDQNQKISLWIKRQTGDGAHPASKLTCSVNLQ